MKINKIFLFFAFILGLILFSCSTTSTGKSPVSKWAGTFSGDGTTGTITDWTFYSDQTFTGTWTISGSSGIELGECSGTYLPLSGIGILGEGTGDATYSGESSKFTLSFVGDFGDLTGDGKYVISFEEDTLTDNDGRWTITRQ